MMKILTSVQILQTRNKQSDTSFNVCFSNVDSSRFFIPEQYTQLYHCDAYSLLSNPQKTRYNQLFAARTNEQFMLFESGFTNTIMENLLQAGIFKNQPSLSDSLVLLLKDEERHFEMFRQLNQHYFPELYAAENYYFLKIPRLQKVLLELFCRYPQHLHALVWLVLLMEEHAVRFSKDLLAPADPNNFDANFVNAHRAHLKDESAHVHIDANVLDYLMSHSSTRKNAINRWLLCKLLRETLKPKRAGLEVIKRLILEFPELSTISKKLIDGIRSFQYDPCMMPMFADRKLTPVTQALLKTYPDFETALVF